MIDTIQKIHTSPNDTHSLFAEVTIESIANQAILLGHNFTDKRTVVFADDVDALIDALQTLKAKYL